MKYIEYAIYDMDFNENEIKQNIEKAITSKVNCISIPYAYVKFAKNLIVNNNIIISTAIDYPLGLADTKSRNCAIINAIDVGCDKIEIVIQNNLLGLRKYDKIRQDIKTNQEICQTKNIPIFYYLEYRVFTHQSLIKACEILQEFGVNTVYPSSGYMIDSIEDNITASVLLTQKTKITTIVSGNVWTKNHLSLLNKNNLTNIRTNNLNSLYLLTS
jgi:deoxyribose-phosphate aldolase